MPGAAHQRRGGDGYLQYVGHCPALAVPEGNLNNGSSGHGIIQNLYAVENPSLYPAGPCLDMYAPNNHPDGAVVGACSTIPVNYAQWWGF